MNNEFNNNQFDEQTGNNEYPKYNNENNLYNNQPNPYGPNPIYPAPQMIEKKPKKKRKVPGAIKLTAAALIFGIVAGAAFQGYYMIMDATGNNPVTEGQNISIAEVSQNSEDTITPANTAVSDKVVTDVSDIAKQVMPSIVAINSTIVQEGRDLFNREYDQQVQGSGSGIIIGQNNSNLLIVTNNHVVQGATSVEIVFSNKKTASAEVKGSDENADLAVLSVDMKNLSEETISAIKVATLGDSSKVEVGEMAIAIGNALGYGQSVTVGYVSAVDREVNLGDKTMTLLQTDAAINPGNSGGALLNSKGQVIGINTVKFSSAGIEGMGYAIPISSAVPMINELINRQEISTDQQGFLGIDAASAQNVTEDFADRFHIPVGIYVNDIVKNSPAEKAGLVQGNIITAVDEVKVKTIEDLANVLSYKKAGQEVALKIMIKVKGDYQEKILKVTLSKKN